MTIRPTSARERAFRYEPLDPARFPVGTSPFRVRGLAFAGMLYYVDHKLAGGRAELLRALEPGDAHGAYYDQIFVASGDYDASAFLQLYKACARIEKKGTGTFIAERSRAAAAHDTQGIWKPMLKTSSPEVFAERSNFAFNRYFEPCRAKVVSVKPGRFEGELAQVPASMNGLYVCSTLGFIDAALSLSGAQGVEIGAELPVSDGEHAGVPTERVSFSATWRS